MPVKELEYTIAYVASASPSPTTATLIPMDELPQNIKNDVEAAYEALKANPQGRFHVSFKDAAEAGQFEAQVKSYCAQVEPPYRYRKSPVKNQPPNEIDFRITDPLTPTEAATEEIREATEAAKKPRKPKAA